MLAFLSKFSEISGLADDDGFSVSALPNTDDHRRGQRIASRVSVGQIEAFYILISPDGNEVTRVNMLTSRDEDLTWIPADVDVDIAPGHFANELVNDVSCSPSAAAQLMTDDRLAAALSRRLVKLRRNSRKRRADYHNSWLWGCVETRLASPPRTPSACAPDPTPDSPDVMRWAAQRTGQQRFRAELLKHYSECAICGITQIEVLEAAHLVAHSGGGSYDVSNGRLMCANHHLAFDRKLYEHDPDTDSFTWVGEYPEPNLGGQRH